MKVSKAVCRSVEPRPGCIESALDILGDKWSPLLLGQLAESPKTFGELELCLSGISPRTLSARLDKLYSGSVLNKALYCNHPPRYKYELTAKGRELSTILSAMAAWGDKYWTQVL